MTIYLLSHLFYRDGGEMISSPKSLGVYQSYELAMSEIDYFLTQPGFRENADAFSIQSIIVSDDVLNDTVFETLVYLHSEEYEFEVCIELGYYGSENNAQKHLQEYLCRNEAFVHAQGLVCEEIINKWVFGQRAWSEGFILERS